MTTTPISYTISADFVPYAAVALQSLVTFARPGDHYQVIFLHEDLTSVDQAALGDLATSQVAVAFYQLDPTVLAGIANRPENFLRADFYTPAIFYRLFIADLFPQYDRALYVDADSVWAADPAPLVNHPLNGQLIAAAPDLSVAHVEPMQEYIRGATTSIPGCWSSTSSASATKASASTSSSWRKVTTSTASPPTRTTSTPSATAKSST